MLVKTRRGEPKEPGPAPQDSAGGAAGRPLSEEANPWGACKAGEEEGLRPEGHPQVAGGRKVAA